ncbi:solute carrier family 25 (mitochondrial carrier protein), member 16 [Kwoniella heveanensis BCC8398]|uniref:Solute carrier family 25 (Mitochondrial carrier protein), member 16 n=1 Tax=Kwoniella heveanensis BCC8398 TaxID=1296120 RepID=A0A1B9GKU3_9TREE|nr:solute carrier family 25 (mitochondrial carrier protein), member 16 [Kwoniella heveanensis BCC8398]
MIDPSGPSSGPSHTYALPLISTKGKERALPPFYDFIASSPLEQAYPSSSSSSSPAIAVTADDAWNARKLWRRSRHRAKTDKASWDYVITSGVAGGIAGCVAKTAVAPLDRVKILMQTSNEDFLKFASKRAGLINALSAIYHSQGIRGLFQGHLATVLRIAPYASIKYMAYDWLERILIDTPEKRTPARFFVAGACAGVTSVLVTYPLELIRVRLAYQTKSSERTTLLGAVKSIYRENDLARSQGRKSNISPLVRAIPIHPFYRGFSITLAGMIPYAGVSFLTYGTLKRHAADYIPVLKGHKTITDLGCGAVAGAISQTASYPFEVVRRRMQVATAHGGDGINWRESIAAIYKAGGLRGFYVGLTIGYIKVVPMTR